MVGIRSDAFVFSSRAWWRQLIVGLKQVTLTWHTFVPDDVYDVFSLRIYVYRP